MAGVDRLLPWLRRSGWAYVVAAIVLAAVAWRLAAGGRDGGQPRPAASGPTAARVERAPAPQALVHVVGEVRRPGVYRLPEGARVVQAVKRAGGLGRRADPSALNLAAMVQDGQQVVVPRRAPAGGAAPAASAPEQGGPVSLSSATAEALEALDGIGPTIATRIVDWRDAHGGFASLEQLLEVPGIGPGRLEALRSQVVP